MPIATGGFGRKRRPADDREARGRHLAPERSEEVDREFSVKLHPEP